MATDAHYPLPCLLAKVRRRALHSDDNTVSSYHTSSSAATVRISNVSNQREDFTLALERVTNMLPPAEQSPFLALAGALKCTGTVFIQRVEGYISAEFFQFPAATVENVMRGFPVVESVEVRRDAADSLQTQRVVDVGEGERQDFSSISSSSAEQGEQR